MSDKTYALWRLRRKFGGEGSIENAMSLNQKIQRLKLSDRRTTYSQLPDKYAVRDYAKEIVGQKYLNEMYGVCDAVSQIDVK